MIMSYKEYCSFLEKRILSGDDFYLSLLKNVIDNPTRYCGLFRLSNARTKLIQNVTQSQEIKFGDIMEDVTTEYLSRLGYKNFDKNLGKDENGDELNVDQYFTDGSKVYVVEMKIRDDHDSTKKRGQYSNFHKKVNLIRKKHPGKHIVGAMWFVDDGLVKNKNYYKGEMDMETFSSCELHLYYGSEFFDSLKDGSAAWAELIEILTKYRIQNMSKDIEIPDFGSSEVILKALIKLDSKSWKKLMSNDSKYDLLRKELFSNGKNLEEAKKRRGIL